MNAKMNCCRASLSPSERRPCQAKLFLNGRARTDVLAGDRLEARPTLKPPARRGLQMRPQFPQLRVIGDGLLHLDKLRPIQGHHHDLPDHWVRAIDSRRGSARPGRRSDGTCCGLSGMRNYSGSPACVLALSRASCRASGVSVLPGSACGSAVPGWSHPAAKSAMEEKVVAKVLFFIMMIFVTG
jgi:hypothetical protein